MNKTLRTALAAALALVLLSGSALAGDAFLVNGFATATEGDTNIRMMPNLEGQILGVLKKDCSAEYLSASAMDARGVMWLMVRCGDVIGWISERYVTLQGVVGDRGEDDREYLEGDSEGPVYDPDGYSAQYVDEGGYLSSYGTVTATGGDSNIRSWADLDSELLGVLKKDQSADYMGSSYTDDRGVRWDYIRYGELYGWISSRYTTLN